MTDMLNACENDIESVERGVPGLAKLKLLPRLIEQTSKQSLQDSFIDAGGLGALREWARLLPNNALPNLSLRTGVLQILSKLGPSITVESLKESHVGHAVRDMIFHEDETSTNRRLANEIAESWLRTIYGRSDGSTLVVRATEDEMNRANAVRRPRVAAVHEEEDGRRRSSAIGNLMKTKTDSLFRVQPVARVSRAKAPVGTAYGERISKAAQQRRQPAAATKVSVEGRGL